MSSSTVGVSVLFSDLVGSTQLAARVGAEQAEALRKTHFAVIRQALQEFDGTEVKNLGDGIMAVFPGVASAVGAAISMQQGLHRHRRLHPQHELHIRVGVAAGDCVEDDGDYFGEAVVQAARLCATCDPDSILTTDVVRLLAPRGRYRFEPRGEMELKGLPEPVAVAEVGWSNTAGHAGTDVPDRLAAQHPVRFVGRARELSVLASAWRSAVDGDRRLVLLSGEAGIGKTRLLSQFATQVAAEGGTVRYGRCDEGVARPYGVWWEALASMVDDLEVGDDQFSMFARLTERVCASAADCPVLLILDDLHWADRGTLQLLRHVVSRVSAAPLMVVAAYRDSDVADNDALSAALAALHREVGVAGATLDGLSSADLSAMATDFGGPAGESVAELAELVLAETAGNAFFAGELFRHLAETGELTHEKVEPHVVRLPSSVRDVVVARVQRLGERVQRTLTTAAVAGRDFDLRVVAMAQGVSEVDVLDDLETAQNAGLVAEVADRVDQFTFAHALVQRTLYSELSASRRARVHRSIAEALQQTFGERADQYAGELALHWFAVGREALGTAVAFAVVAGNQARASSAPLNAVGWYLRAFEALPSEREEQRCEVMVSLGEAEHLAGVEGSRERLLEAARQARRLGRVDLLVRAALCNHRGFQSNTAAGIDHERVEILEAALEASPQRSGDRARLLAILSAELRFEGTTRYLDLTRESISLAREVGDSTTLIDVLIGSSFVIPHVFAERRAVTAALLASTDGNADLVRRFGALHSAILTALIAGDGHQAVELHAEMLTITDRLRQPTRTWVASVWRTALATVGARDDEAAQAAEETLRLGLEASQPDAMLYYGGALMALQLQKVRLDEVIDLLQLAIVQYPQLRVYRYALISCLSQAGRFEELRPSFDSLSMLGFDVPLDQTWLQCMLFAAEAACGLRDRDAAAVLLERIEPFSDQVAIMGAMNCMGAVGLWSGRLHMLLGRFDTAEQLLRSALETSERLGAPQFRVRALVALAEVVERRDASEAIDLREQAVSLCDAFGLAGLRASML
jgi:class 3 adenylate cyclase/tetratricopeptide (TPR) repeat protein